MEGPIRIAYVCDKHYLPYLQKSIESVKRYNKNVDIVVLTGDKDLEVPGVKTFYYEMNSSFFKFKPNDRMKDGVYHKLFLPLLPYNKILYIDCDVICQRPLNELWNIDCPFICATESYSVGKEQAKRLKIPTYFLTGMMLMNLKELRKQNFTERCLQRLKNTQDVIQHDETIINLEFNNQIKNIDVKYNYCKNRPYENSIPEGDAYLLHFVGSEKSQLLKRTNFEELNKLKEFIKDKSVAIVGNSQSIFSKKQGQNIDNHDIVIRFNKGYPIRKDSQGTKTDILFLACTLKPQELEMFNAKFTVRRSKYCGNKCNFELTSNDKIQFTQDPNNESKRLREKVSQASTGFLALQFCLSSECKIIDLYGFDGFKNITYYNNINYKTTHNGDKELEKILEYEKYNLLKIDNDFKPLITRVSITYGIGDALNARAFLAEYCRQKNIKRSSIKIYSPKHWWMFEGMGFTRDYTKNLKGLTSYRNFGNYNLDKIYEDDKLDKCIAENAGIKFSFDNIELLPNYEQPNIKLPKKFITFNTGYGILSGKPLEQNFICIKSWPIEYWKKLIKLLDIPCVQIGAGPSCKIVPNCALNLVDKLTLKESAEVMRKALFHIDIEGGLPILNQHLGKKSVVLFGPTAIENQGRSFNLNIRNSKCPACYEWGIHTKSLSMKKEELKCNAHCMTDLTPEYVMQKIKESGLLP